MGARIDGDQQERRKESESHNSRFASILRGRDDLISIHRLGGKSPWPDAVQGRVRPDGYLGYVARGARLEGLRASVERWLPAQHD
ncbi:hypothetical protein [Streptomyces sp. NPDC002758]